MNLSYLAGSLVHRAGYRIERDYRFPESKIDLIRLGCLALRSMDGRPLTIVQIGAFDGELVDPLRRLLADSTARVLLVEPQPEPFEKLQALYRDRPNIVLERAAIADRDGSGVMYVPDETSSSPMASLDREHAKRFFGDGVPREIEVPTTTVASLFAKHHIERPDVLQIDAEGHDFKILMQVFEAGREPRIINLETFHLDRRTRTQLRDELATRGFESIDHGFDTFAIKLDYGQTSAV